MRNSSAVRAANFAILLLASAAVLAQAPASPATQTPQVPDWALPGSPTHKQVPPPADFHRPTVTFNQPIGIFENQSDIGGPLVPGSASYDPATKQYTIHSAGYNIWYQRDEFRYLWKKMSGDVSLAADVSFPDPNGYGDRKVVLVFRQSLDDDSKEAMIGEHGAGMIHLAWRPDRGAQVQDMQYRFSGGLNGVHAKRIGIEKHGDEFAIFISLTGEPMHQFGPPITLHFDEPFYVGIGFCSHQPATVDTAVVSDVKLENAPGRISNTLTIPRRVNISAAIAARLLEKHTSPVQPSDVDASGTIVLGIVIGPDGRVEGANYISGPPILSEAAIDAVRTWTYRPFLLNNQPIEVATTVDVVFHR